MAELKRRLKKLEAVIESRDESHRLEIEFGYIQRLPPEYQGVRHLVVKDQLPWNGVGNGLYEWEEVEGPATNDDQLTDPPTILRIAFVRPEPYRLGDARRELEAEARQGNVN
jgi:hypothetical protein